MGARLPPLPETRCSIAGKRSFTKEAAECYAAEWATHNTSAYDVYECPCGDYHLTHPRSGLDV